MDNENIIIWMYIKETEQWMHMMEVCDYEADDWLNNYQRNHPDATFIKSLASKGDINK